MEIKKIAVYIDNDNNIWFNAKDTVKSLGYKDLKKTINTLYHHSYNCKN